MAEAQGRQRGERGSCVRGAEWQPGADALQEHPGEWLGSEHAGEVQGGLQSRSQSTSLRESLGQSKKKKTLYLGTKGIVAMKKFTLDQGWGT